MFVSLSARTVVKVSRGMISIANMLYSCVSVEVSARGVIDYQ